MQLSVIIVNFNVKYFLEQCLYSVVKACKNIDAEIIVIDNNSTDGSREYLSEKFDSVNFIWRDKNVGYAKANNIALAKASGEYILFLNPDTIVPEDCFEKCLTYFETNRHAGALGVRLIDGSGIFLKESKRELPSPLTSLFKLSGLATLFPHSKTFARYYAGHLDEFGIHEVDVLVGAFMMLSKVALDKTGSFDESFFMYGEDIDLSYRIQQAGFVNIYFSGTTVIHFKGESTKRGSLNYVRMFYGAMQKFVKKHYTGSKAKVYIIFINTAIWLRAVVAGISRVGKNLFWKKSKQNPDISNLIVVGDKVGFDMVLRIFKNSNRRIKINGQIHTGIVKDVQEFGCIDDLPELVKKNKINEVVFCENDFSFKEIIDTIQRLPVTVRCLFHASGSQSVICSDSKDESGEYFAGGN